jgi:poly-gamma-glutamate synthesis protein (capsule biosynthesis protein)
LTGDAVVTRPLTGPTEPEYRALLDLLRRADAAATNLETLFHDYPGPAMPALPALRSDPKLARDLAWAGFDLVARANNHAADYGAPGLRETTRHVAAAGLAQAGAGEDLAAARRAAIFRSAAGRVALVSATSTFADYALAVNPRGRIPGRPGVSPLRVHTTYLVRREELERLRGIARQTGQNPPAEGDVLDFGDRRFSVAPEPGVSEELDAGDLAELSSEVRRASGEADVTLVSIHCHESFGGDREKPPGFLGKFARAMIDAGADAVFGHGAHILRGIEIYRGKPILYSLGNFLFEYETVEELPADDYEAVGLPSTARPGDFFDLYDRGGERGYPSEPEIWESAVALARFEGKRLRKLELYPISLGFGKPRGERGRPVLADAPAARRILERLARLSDPFGTRITIDGAVGRVELPDSPP